MVSKIYDSLGLGALFLLRGKRILQDLRKTDYGRDDIVSETHLNDWEQWPRELQLIERLEMRRCYKPVNFGSITNCSLHHFSNTSQNGYGQIPHLRLMHEI